MGLSWFSCLPVHVFYRISSLFDIVRCIFVFCGLTSHLFILEPKGPVASKWLTSHEICHASTVHGMPAQPIPGEMIKFLAINMLSGPAGFSARYRTSCRNHFQLFTCACYLDVFWVIKL